ncbi:hypothetical protein ABH912_001557 [Pseudomonas sp. BT76 TE3572]|uniref:hypothetical protein n=1 Tax=Pseudomonas TaxID=286 RepID=UPI003D191328
MKDRLKVNGKAPKQIICAALRKLLHFVYGVLKSGQPYDLKLALAPREQAPSPQVTHL